MCSLVYNIPVKEERLPNWNILKYNVKLAHMQDTKFKWFGWYLFLIHV